jgi:hypothetical protein
MSEKSFATILIGDSHYAAIATAAQQFWPFSPNAGSCDLIFFDAWRHSLRYEFVKYTNDQPHLNPDLVKSLSEIARRYDQFRIVTVLGGGHHLALTLLDNGHPMDVILPTEPELHLRNDAQIVTVDFAKEILLQIMKSTLLTLSCLRKAFPLAFITQIECPPPIGDNDFIRSHLGDFFKASAPPEELDALSTPAQRYKFWRIQSEIFSTECADFGIEYMPVPAACRTENGFMKPEHYGTDSTHANSVYGGLILDFLQESPCRPITAWNCFG